MGFLAPFAFSDFSVHCIYDASGSLHVVSASAATRLSPAGSDLSPRHLNKTSAVDSHSFRTSGKYGGRTSIDEVVCIYES
jgi:hypothetical protein